MKNWYCATLVTALVVSLTACGDDGSSGPSGTLQTQVASGALTEGNAAVVAEAGGFTMPVVVHRQGDFEIYMQSLTYDGRQTWANYNPNWGEPPSRMYALSEGLTLWTNPPSIVVLDHETEVPTAGPLPSGFGTPLINDATDTAYLPAGDAIYRLVGLDWFTIELGEDFLTGDMALHDGTLYSVNAYGSAFVSAFQMSLADEEPESMPPPPNQGLTDLRLFSTADGVVAVNERLLVRWEEDEWVSLSNDAPTLQTLGDRKIMVCEGQIYLGAERQNHEARRVLTADSFAGPFEELEGLPVEIDHMYCDEQGPVMVGARSFFFPDGEGQWRLDIERPTGRLANVFSVPYAPATGYVNYGGVAVRWSGESWQPIEEASSTPQRVDGRYLAFRLDESGESYVEEWSEDLVDWEDGASWPEAVIPRVFLSVDGTWIAYERSVESNTSSDGSTQRTITTTRIYHAASEGEGHGPWSLVYDGETTVDVVFGDRTVTVTGDDGPAVDAAYQLSSGRLIGSYHQSEVDVSDDNGRTWQTESTELGFLGGPHEVGISSNDSLLLVTEDSQQEDGSAEVLVVADGGAGPQTGTITVKPPENEEGEALRVLPETLRIGPNGKLVGFAGDPWPVIFESEQGL